jgi:hypothetical protein
MNSNTFWTFSTLLIVLTLLSSLGGGLRYRENFMENLFETIQNISNENDTNYISDEILKRTIISEEMPQLLQNVTEEIQQQNVIPVRQVEEPMEAPKQVVQPSPYRLIEAFDGDQFASF